MVAARQKSLNYLKQKNASDALAINNYHSFGNIKQCFGQVKVILRYQTVYWWLREVVAGHPE